MLVKAAGESEVRLEPVEGALVKEAPERSGRASAAAACGSPLGGCNCSCGGRGDDAARREGDRPERPGLRDDCSTPGSSAQAQRTLVSAVTHWSVLQLTANRSFKQRAASPGRAGPWLYASPCLYACFIAAPLLYAWSPLPQHLVDQQPHLRLL